MERQKKSFKQLMTEKTKKIFSIDNKIFTTKGNLVCDAVPDPPRVSDDDHDVENRLKNIGFLNGLGKNESTEKKADEKKNRESVDESSSKNSSSAQNDSERRKKENDRDERPEQSNNASVKNITLNHCNDIKITSNRLYNFNIQNQPRTEQRDECTVRKMPPYMQTLKASRFEISRNDMDLVKLHIGKRWRSTARHLGYSDGQIEQYEEMHGKYGPGEVFYQILLDWKQCNTTDATIGRLVEALWCSEEDDCLDKVATVHLQVKRA